MLCKPAFMEGSKNYLELGKSLDLNNLLTIMFVSLGCLYLFGICEKLLIKYRSKLECCSNCCSSFSDKLGLMVASIIYSATLFSLYQYQFDKTNFCLMNDDPLCDDVDLSCFTLANNSKSISASNFGFGHGGIIKLNPEGHRLT